MEQTHAIHVSRRLIALVRPLAGHMTGAVLLGTLGHVAAASIPVLGGVAILSALGFPMGISWGGALILLIVAAVLRGPLRYGEQFLNHHIAFRLLALIRSKVFAQMRRLAPARLEGRDRGNLIALITSDVELLEVFYAHTISPSLIALLMTLLLSILVSLLHPAFLGVVLLAHGTLGVWLPLWAGRSLASSGDRLRATSGRLSSYILDTLRGRRDVLQYQMEKARIQTMDELGSGLVLEEARQKKINAAIMARTNVLVLFFDGLMLGVGVALYQAGQIGFPAVVLSFLLLASCFGPVLALSALGGTLQGPFAAARRILALLDEAPEVLDVSGHKPVAFTGAAAEHLHFSYGDQPVLKDVSLRLTPGKVLGIMGPSGSGKSTLLKLFLRYFEAPPKSLTLSGRSLSAINTDNLRNMESVMTQETHLFEDTLWDNLILANPAAMREEVLAACEAASLTEVVARLPEGLKTPMGPQGSRLSAGERQRVGLARALLHPAPFLLLDEPTSNLDSLNEAVILRSLKAQRGRRAILLVSHRSSVMGLADEVLFMEEGCLQGTPHPFAPSAG
ncbi:putative ABC transporter [Clostridiaceae bacterium JG1575]|nr:putative ABC transporter [Clostridiaceae bacterium JG1575]